MYGMEPFCKEEAQIGKLWQEMGWQVVARGALSPPGGWPLYRFLAVLHDGGADGGPDGDFLPFVARHHV